MRAWLIPVSLLILLLIWGFVNILVGPRIMGWIAKRLFGAEIDYAYKPPPRKWWQPDTSLNLHLKDDQSLFGWKSWALTFIFCFIFLAAGAIYVLGFAVNVAVWLSKTF